ncbi:hypothetical protein GF354_01540, partial [Candidatus Peregrinibacteria bacterium]|nr:hypothetical protein [Candidatus Peregrinibacteria bacterium]
MGRGFFAGDTDYKHQSLKDMRSDLKDWVISIKSHRKSLKKKIKELEGTVQWKEKMPQDFEVIVEKSMALFETAIEELRNISKEVKKEVREDHITRLNKLGVTADEMSKRYG